jgi:two-component system sensor histidine kinase TctE
MAWLLSIEDSGSGIDDELAQRLFQPFSAGDTAQRLRPGPGHLPGNRRPWTARSSCATCTTDSAACLQALIQLPLHNGDARTWILL